MAFSDDDAMERRLGNFLNGRIGRHLARREQRESFALYAHGILADGERKSVEPIAARATGSDEENPEVEPALSRSRACRSIRSTSHFVASKPRPKAFCAFHCGEARALSGACSWQRCSSGSLKRLR